MCCYCLLIQLISDAGYQGEITSVSTACHQIEVFSRVLRTSISMFLQYGEEALEKHLPEFTVRHSFVTSLLGLLRKEVFILLDLNKALHLFKKVFAVLYNMLQKMVCHGEHTYLYSQVLMHVLAQESKGGSNIRRLCQEVQQCASDK